MREIKFRGHDGSKWLYGDVVSYKSPVLEDTEYWMADYNSDKDNDDIQNWESVSYVGQYTGLKDRNGKEIYEGDIVHHEAWLGAASLRKDIIGPVIFTDGCFAIKTRYGNKYLYTGINKVIGNIYENSELVEDTK